MLPRPDSVPIRLFRIQGKKAVVQAAVALIEQAVAKYKDLCECKRRGEFVQREHVIGGVEFYYQPPPRKAFANNGNEQSPKAAEGPQSVLSTAAPFPPHHVWLQHLQQQQQVQAVAAAAAQQKHSSLLEVVQALKLPHTIVSSNYHRQSVFENSFRVSLSVGAGHQIGR